MRSRYRVGSTIALVALLGACASSGKSEAVSSAASPAAPSAAEGSATQGLVLAATFQGSYPGEVRLTSGASSNRTQVVLSVRGGSSGSGLAWQIKRGLCSDPNAAVEVGRPTSYPTLTVRGDGTARFSGSINVGFPQGAPHFVVITRSRSDDTIVACGDLRPGSA